MIPYQCSRAALLFRVAVSKLLSKFDHVCGICVKPRGTTYSVVVDYSCLVDSVLRAQGNRGCLVVCRGM